MKWLQKTKSTKKNSKDFGTSVRANLKGTSASAKDKRQLDRAIRWKGKGTPEEKDKRLLNAVRKETLLLERKTIEDYYGSQPKTPSNIKSRKEDLANVDKRLKAIQLKKTGGKVPYYYF